MKIELGKKYKDQITGFEGVAAGVCYYLSGCNQVLLVPPISADGNFRESQWFDVQRMKELEGEKIVLINDETPGFDKTAPKM